MAIDYGMVAPGTPAPYGSGSTIINGALGSPSTAAMSSTPNANPLSQINTAGASTGSSLSSNPLSTYASNVTPASNYTAAPNTGVTPGSPSGGGSFSQGSVLPTVSTVSTAQTAAPSFYTDYLNNLSQQGQQAATGAKFAGATNLQNQAFTDVAQNVGNYAPALQNAINLASGVGSTNLSDAIGDVGQANIRNNLAPQATAGLVGSGQFGSFRGAQALGDTVANAELGLTQQQALAKQQDIQNQLAASQQLGNLATTQQNLGLNDVNALSTLGGQQQTINQNEQLFPMQQLTNESALLRGYTIPTSVSTTSTGPGQQGQFGLSPLQQISSLAALTAGLSNTNLGQQLFGTNDTVDKNGNKVPATPGALGSLSSYIGNLFKSNPTTTPTTPTTAINDTTGMTLSPNQNPTGPDQAGLLQGSDGKWYVDPTYGTGGGNSTNPDATDPEVTP